MVQNGGGGGGATLGGGSGLGIGVLVVWLAGFWHIAMPNEVAAVIGSLALGAGAAIGNYGLEGCWHRVIHGRAVTIKIDPPD